MRLKQVVKVRHVLLIIRIYYNKTKSFTKQEIFNFIYGKSIQLIANNVPVRYMSCKSTVFIE